MRKALLPLLLILVLCLAACGGPREVSDMPLSVELKGDIVEGTYTGTVEKKLPQGEGVFRYSGEGKSISCSGAWENGIPVGTSVLEYEGMSFVFDGQEYTGTYSGEASALQPDGRGTFAGTSASGSLALEGTWENGVFGGTGTIKVSPYETEYLGTKYSGSYEGGIKVGKASGSGTFTSDALELAGQWEDGAFTGSGSISAVPVDISFLDTSWSGTYSGEIRDHRPDGQGSFAADPESGNLTLEGLWSEGSFSGSGSMSISPFTVKYGKKTYTGSYSGEISDGRANGSGRFIADEKSGIFDYDGIWTDGEIVGTGKITCDSFAVTNSAGKTRTGQYSGDVKDGLPDGEGTFSYTDRYRITITYTGGWKKGLHDGYGKTEWSDGDYSEAYVTAGDPKSYLIYHWADGFIYEGTLTGNRYTPTISEFFNSLTQSYCSTRLSEEMMALLEENEAAIREHTDLQPDLPVSTSLDYRDYLNNPESYEGTALKLRGKLIQTGKEQRFGVSNSYALFQPTDTGDIYYISWYGKLSTAKNTEIELTMIPLGVYKNTYSASWIAQIDDYLPCIYCIGTVLSVD